MKISIVSEKKINQFPKIKWLNDGIIQTIFRAVIIEKLIFQTAKDVQDFDSIFKGLSLMTKLEEESTQKYLTSATNQDFRGFSLALRSLIIH